MTDKLSVVELIVAVMRDVRSVGKADTNTHFGFKFRGIDTVLDAVGPKLRDHGVVPVPELRSITSEMIGKNNRVIVEVAYTFYGPAGDHITAVVPGEAMDQQDKASSKAMSVAFRTALLQVLAIPTGERDPHAGPPVSAKLAALREQVKAAGQEKGWDFERLRGEYYQWCQEDHDIAEAGEGDLEKFLKGIRPAQRMQRPGPKPGAR